MNFDWTTEQQELHDGVASFARGRLVEPLLAREAWDRAAWTACGEFGLLGLCVPERHGGMGCDALTTAYPLEALGQACPNVGMAFSVSAHMFAAAMPLVEAGSAELIAKLVPGMCSGELVGANAITEAEAGSDVFSLATRVSKVGDDYVIDGVKSYVTNGPVADVFIVYGNLAPENGYLGITAFAVERDTSGLTVGEPFETAGMKGAPISSVYLDGCRVPAANRIGDEGQGAQIFTGSMLWERSCLFAVYLGAMQRQLDQAVDYARSRKQFRRPIGKHQGVSHRIADMKLRLEAARLLLYRACWRRDQGHEASLEVSLSKLATSEAAIQSGLDAIQIHGGAGFASETGIEQALRDALPATIFSGTSEIQRNLIARELGL